MTESEARTKPISEVWEHFQGAQSLIGKHIPPYFSKHHEELAEISNSRLVELSAMLRAVLLERCEKEWGILIVGDCASMPPRTEMSVYVADEFISVLSFIARELKQRGNELQKG